MSTSSHLLLKEVTHDGILRPAGSRIELNALQVDFCVEHGVIAKPVQTIRAAAAEPSSFPSTVKE